VGEGLSYAFSIPAVERSLHNEYFDVEHNTSKLMNYLMFELSFAVPKTKHWHIFTRIHHRSGVFGLFNDATDGSNVLAIGTRYDF
jgi:hypothetical protein